MATAKGRNWADKVDDEEGTDVNGDAKPDEIPKEKRKTGRPKGTKTKEKREELVEPDDDTDTEGNEQYKHLKDEKDSLQEELQNVKAQLTDVKEANKQSVIELKKCKDLVTAVDEKKQQSEKELHNMKGQLSCVKNKQQLCEVELKNVNDQLLDVKMEKQQLDTNVRNINVDLADLRKQLKQERVEKEDILDQLQNAKELLAEERQSTSELFSQLDTLRESTGETEIRKARGLIIKGRHMNNIIEHIIMSNVEWEICPDVETIGKMIEMIQKGEQLKEFQRYEKVLIMLGTEDIAVKSVNGDRAFTELIRAVRKLTKETEVAIVELPPTNAGTKINIEVGVFNRKMYNLKEDRIQRIKITDKFDMISRAKAVEGDGITPTDNVCKMIGEAISDQITIPNPTAKDNKHEHEHGTVIEDTDEDIVEIYEFPKDKNGRVVGSGGSTIRALKEKTDTGMFVLTWDEFSDERNGAIIRGKRMNIKKAKEEIEAVLQDKNDDDNKYNSKKRKPKETGYKSDKKYKNK